MNGEAFDDLRFYECPLSCIATDTWQMLELIDETTNADGDIIHLPFPGGLFDQPGKYREARRLVKRERSANRARKLKRT